MNKLVSVTQFNEPENYVGLEVLIDENENVLKVYHLGREVTGILHPEVLIDIRHQINAENYTSAEERNFFPERDVKELLKTFYSQGIDDQCNLGSAVSDKELEDAIIFQLNVLNGITSEDI